MYKIKKSLLSVIGVLLLLTNISESKKQVVPIVMDDIVTMASYNTSINKLKISDIPPYNTGRRMLVQCEEDITYFIVSIHGDTPYSLTSTSGKIVYDEVVEVLEGKFIKGHIDGDGPMRITAKTDFDEGVLWLESAECRTQSTSKNELELPTFSDTSQGSLLVQCEDDVVYYIMSYHCYGVREPNVEISGGKNILDEKSRLYTRKAMMYYVKGHIERTGGAVSITGNISYYDYNGYKTVSSPNWKQTCP